MVQSWGPVDRLRTIAEVTRYLSDTEMADRSLRRANLIRDDVHKAIEGTPAANSGVELDAITRNHPNLQMKAVEWVRSGEVKNFREAKRILDHMLQKAVEDIRSGSCL